MANLTARPRPLHAVTVVWEPGADVPLRVLAGADPLSPDQVVGLLRAAACQHAADHHLNGRDCLEQFLTDQPPTERTPT